MKEGDDPSSSFVGVRAMKSYRWEMSDRPFNGYIFELFITIPFFRFRFSFKFHIPEYKKCNLWWCFRDARMGALRISFGDRFIDLPYCEKHRDVAIEVGKEIEKEHNDKMYIV